MNEQLSVFLKELADNQVFWPFYVAIIAPLAVQALLGLGFLIERIVRLVQDGKATEMERSLVGVFDARSTEWVKEYSRVVKAYSNVGRAIGRLEAKLE